MRLKSRFPGPLLPLDVGVKKNLALWTPDKLVYTPPANKLIGNLRENCLRQRTFTSTKLQNLFNKIKFSKRWFILQVFLQTTFDVSRCTFIFTRKSAPNKNTVTPQKIYLILTIRASNRSNQIKTWIQRSTINDPTSLFWRPKLSWSMIFSVS